jgi:hypothetical protein
MIIKVSPGKLREWTETLETIQHKLPAEVSYNLLQSYGEVRHYLDIMLRQVESEYKARETDNGRTEDV